MLSDAQITELRFQHKHHDDFIRAVEAAARREALEEAAQAAWRHYMDECKRKGINAAHYGEWIASNTIRALLAQPTTSEPHGDEIDISDERVDFDAVLQKILDLRAQSADAKDAARWRYANTSEDFAICYWDDSVGDSGDWVPHGIKGDAISVLDAAMQGNQEGE